MNRIAIGRKTVSATLAVALLLFGATISASARNPNPRVFPVKSKPYGKSYGEWSAEWLKWATGLPVDGHPFLDETGADQSTYQNGPVWFVSGPLSTIERSYAIPVGKSVLLTLLSAGCDSLEDIDSGFHGDTEEEQRACAKFWADHIRDVFLEIDGRPLNNAADYRVVSPQFEFTAPTPWIFGDIGGTGTSVNDGYFVMITPLSKGPHTLRYGGSIHFSVEEGDDFDFDLSYETTDHITIVP